MSIDVIMPQLGETVAEGKIVTWFKAVGDSIKPGENLFEVETDKVTVEVPVIAGGVVSDIRVEAGAVAKVGAVVAVIAAPGEAVASHDASSRPKHASGASKPPISATPKANLQAAATALLAAPVALDPFREVRTPERNYGPGRLPNGAQITPLARRLAHEAGITVDRLKGSGPHGRVTARDVEDAMSRQPVAKGASPGAAALAPATTLFAVDVALDKLLALRDDANAAAPKDKDGQPDFVLTLGGFVVKALAIAMKRVMGDVHFAASDIALIDGDGSSTVIRKAESKPLSAIAGELKNRFATTGDNRSASDQPHGVVASITDLSAAGLREAYMAVTPPLAMALAFGAIRRAPVESANGIAFVSAMTVTLSCDAGVVDTAQGADLLATLKSLLENPVTMLV